MNVLYNEYDVPPRYKFTVLAMIDLMNLRLIKSTLVFEQIPRIWRFRSVVRRSFFTHRNVSITEGNILPDRALTAIESFQSVGSGFDIERDCIDTAGGNR